LFVRILPAIAMADIVKVLKGVTVHLLFERFPKLQRQLSDSQPWSTSSSVGRAGNVSAETIGRYIERRKLVTYRR